MCSYFYTCSELAVGTTRQLPINLLYSPPYIRERRHLRQRGHIDLVYCQVHRTFIYHVSRRVPKQIRLVTCHLSHSTASTATSTPLHQHEANTQAFPALLNCAAHLHMLTRERLRATTPPHLHLHLHAAADAPPYHMRSVLVSESPMQDTLYMYSTVLTWLA
jgi:hypothetical protein